MTTARTSLPLLALGAIAVLTFLGFLGYRYGFLDVIMNVMMAEGFGGITSLHLLSILFGTAAFFSPCALTVLPSYVSHYLGREEAEHPSLPTLLSLGVLGALGIIAVNLAIGAIIALLGSAAPFAKDPRQDIVPVLAVRTIAGLLITLLGYFTLTGKRVKIPFTSSLLTQGDLKRSVFGYGVIYNAAAVGCTGPILLGLMLYAIQAGSGSALLSFSVFSLTMGLWMVILTVLAGLFKRAVVKPLVAPIAVLQKVTGTVMLIVGLTIAILTLERNRIFVALFFPFLP